MRPPVDQILSICANFAGHGYYVGELIPDHKLEHFRREVGSLVLPPGESVIALLDCTLFGSNKEGIAISTNGVYWNNDSSMPRKGFLSWDEIARGPIQRHGHTDVRIGTGKTISLAGCGFPADSFSLMLIDIQTHLLRSRTDDAGLPTRETAPSLPAAVPGKWQLAVSGTQSGWYAASTIRSLVAAGRINPADALVWRPGLTDWIPLTSVAELSEVPGGADAVRCSRCGHQNEADDRFCGGCGGNLTRREPVPDVVPAAPRGAPTSDANAHTSRRIDLNSAPVDALLGLPRVTLAAAAALTGERDRRGGFATVEEVGEFLSLQPHEVERLRERVIFGPYPAGGDRERPTVIDLNRATETELARLPGIGAVYAKKAVAARARVGAFTSIEQFGNVLNLPPHTIERLQEVATVGPSPRQPTFVPGARIVDY